MRNWQVVNLDEELKILTADMRRKYHLKLGDAFIAAIALQATFPLLTADRAFQKIEELEVQMYAL